MSKAGKPRVAPAIPGQRKIILWIAVIASLSVYFLTQGMVMHDAIPFGDGAGYTRDALRLHGLLYAGKWNEFVAAFFSGDRSLFPPGLAPYFLVPTRWAYGQAYGLLNCAMANFLVAVAVLGICREIGRIYLAPAVYLLVLSNNYLFLEDYFFHLDWPFAAWFCVCIWLQIRHWSHQGRGNAFWTGAAFGYLFFIKPANALMLVAFGVVAEIVHYLSSKKQRVNWVELLWLTAGFFLLAGVAAWFGAAKAIVEVYRANEVSGYFTTSMTDAGMLRFIYFPLCLSYFYHLVFLCVLFAAAWVWRRVEGARNIKSPEGPWPRALTVIFLVYIIGAGLVFSFWMKTKTMRALLWMLPLIWIVLFASMNRWRYAVKILTTIAAVYFFFAYSQIFSDNFEPSMTSAEDFQLTDSWWRRFPYPRNMIYSDMKITREILQMTQRIGFGENSKIGVGSESIYCTAPSFNWLAHQDDLRLGRSPLMQFVNIADNLGNPISSSMKDLNGVVLIIAPKLQSAPMMQFNLKMIDFLNKHKDQLMRGGQIYDEQGKPLFISVLFKEKWTDSKVAEIIREVSPQGASPYVK